MLSGDDVFWSGIVGIGVGLLMFGRSFRLLKRKRLIENTPTSKIRSLAMGLVEISGEVVSGAAPLASPITAASCVYWAFTIEEYRRSGKSRRWVTVKQAAEGQPFRVRDDTGEVLVDPAGAEVEIPADLSCQSGSGAGILPEAAAFMEQQGIGLRSFLGISKQLRVTERYLAPQDRVFILGTAGDNPQVAEATAATGVQDIMIQRGAGNIFYIADRSEKECLTAHGRSLFLQVFGGAGLAIGSLAFVLWKLQLFT